MNEILDVTPDDESYAAVLRLRKDIAEAAKVMTEKEARFLVDLYYQIQGYRIAAFGQIRMMAEEPTMTLGFLADQAFTLEKQIGRALDLWTRDHEVSQWARSICGVGPVIAAGLRAHLDITHAPTVGHWWRFAGLDPTSKWEKGQKRPWNASLKVLCWKIGQSFVKVSGREADIYGKVYLTRKAYEAAKNESGDYLEQAKAGAARVGKSTDAYKHYAGGKLSPGHLHARACRYAVKLFLAHYHEVAYRKHHGAAPPLPYPIAHMGHAHHVPAPNV